MIIINLCIKKRLKSKNLFEIHVQLGSSPATFEVVH